MTPQKFVTIILMLIAIGAWGYSMTRPAPSGNSPAGLVGLIAVVLSLVAMFWPEKKKTAPPQQ